MAIYYGMVSTRSSEAYTAYALASFFKHTRLRDDDRFFLIDNDATLAVPAQPALTLIRNHTPRSFAQNVNRVLCMALEDDRDLVFVNNDIIFTPHWNEPLVAEARTILVPACNQTLPLEYAGWRVLPIIDLDHYLGHEDDLERLAGLLRADPRFHGRTEAALHLGFYAFLLPQEIGRAVGLFDEAFGVGGGEDVDYRLRAHLAGFDVRVTYDSYLLHFMGRSTWLGPETREETQARDRQYQAHFARKWGQDLALIFLFGAESRKHISRLGLDPLLESQDYAALIRSCLERQERPETPVAQSAPDRDGRGSAGGC